MLDMSTHIVLGGVLQKCSNRIGIFQKGKKAHL